MVSFPRLHGGGWTPNIVRALLGAKIQRSQGEGKTLWLDEGCEECLDTRGHLCVDKSIYHRGVGDLYRVVREAPCWHRSEQALISRSSI